MSPDGVVRAIYRYPVKSMIGESLDVAALGWHGLDGDRRFAFLRETSTSGFPWMNATRLGSLMRYAPVREPGGDVSRVAAPDGTVYDLFGAELRERLSAEYGEPVRVVKNDRGIFDEAAVSLIAEATAAEIARLSETEADPRRFRPNIVIEGAGGRPFGEDAWVGKALAFGEAPGGPAIAVTMRDERCSLINLAPDTGVSSPRVLKSVVATNGNCAGVYASVLRPGTIAVGDPVAVSDLPA